MKTCAPTILVLFLAVPARAFTPQGHRSNDVVKSLRRNTALSAWSPFEKSPAPIVEEISEIVELTPGPLDAKNALAAAVWVSLVGYAFLLAPGEIGSAADSAMIERLLSQPVPRPEEVNQLWFAVWNCFAVVPALLAGLSAPAGQGQRLPAAPFLWGSGALGYFALGPYFATRTDRPDPIRKSDLGWASRTIFENRAFGAVLSAITLSIPFSSDLFAPGFDFSAAVDGYVSLAAGSRFVTVAGLDIAIMSVLAAGLVVEDCKRRGWEDKAVGAGVASLLLPVLGPSLYLVVRPSLEE